MKKTRDDYSFNAKPAGTIGGGKAGPGRPKGSLNKFGMTARESIVEVFERLGGVEGMVAWAKRGRNRTEFYRLYARLLPHEITATPPKKIDSVRQIPLDELEREYARRFGPRTIADTDDNDESRLWRRH